jgi:regulatory LuxR family protein
MNDSAADGAWRRGTGRALLGRGRSNPEIAAEPHVSRKTVSSGLEHSDAKVGVKSRTGAALCAMRHGPTGAAGAPGT